MAVTKMALANIVAEIQDAEQVCDACIDCGFIHMELNDAPIQSDNAEFRLFEGVNPYSETVRKIEEFAANAQMELFARGKVCEDIESIMEHIAQLDDTYRRLYDEKNRLKKLMIEDENILKQLSHIQNVTIHLDDLFSLKFVGFRFGRMPADSYGALQNYTGSEDFCFYPSSIEAEYVWGMYFAPKSVIKKIDAFFINLSFERVRISDRVQGTPEEAKNTLANEITDSKHRISTLDTEMDELLDKHRDYVQGVYSYVKFMYDSFELRRYATVSKNMIYLTGWIDLTHKERLLKQFEGVYSVSIIFETPAETPYTPPTKLKNFFLFRPFEEFVKMYGVPSYNELDPTPLLAITYTLLFGIMFGDLGQGFLLLVCGIAYTLWKKADFGRIIATLGVSSMVFGGIYGSLFGYEDILPGLIKPLENTNMLLGASLVIGGIIITISILFNILNGIKQKNYEKILFGHNGLIGLVLYWSLVLAVAQLLIFQTSWFSWWYVTFLIVLPLLVIFFREPLSHILSKKRGEGQTIGEFITVNLFELFDYLLSYITNTISFLRVGAFVISHVSMMMVVFILATLTSAHPNILVVIIGNLFVVGFEGFIVGIQVLRLEFYEMFSRFFSGEGKEFEPVKSKQKLEK